MKLRLTFFIGVALLVVTGAVWWSQRSRPSTAASSPVFFPSNVVALVGGRVITAEQLQGELGRHGAGASAQQILERLVDDEAAYQCALNSGYARDPRVVAAVRRSVLAAASEDAERAAAYAPTPNEVAGWYAKNLHRFGVPEQRRAGIIFVQCSSNASAQKRSEVRERAERIRAQALADAQQFSALAQKFSDDQATRYSGGNAGWLTAGATNDNAFADKLFQLRAAGELGPVVETPAGFYVVRLSELKPAAVRPLPEVRDAIIYWLKAEKQELALREKRSAARAALDIRINRALLDSLPQPVTPSVPPRLPGPQNASLSVSQSIR